MSNERMVFVWRVTWNDGSIQNFRGEPDLECLLYRLRQALLTEGIVRIERF